MNTSSLAEHTDALLYLLLLLIGILGWMMKRWDASHLDRDMEHTKALSSVVNDMKILSTQVNELQKDFYELRGEHNAHHTRRKDDRDFDDSGFRMSHIHERKFSE